MLLCMKEGRALVWDVTYPDTLATPINRSLLEKQEQWRQKLKGTRSSSMPISTQLPRALCACGSGDSGCDQPRVRCLPLGSGRYIESKGPQMDLEPLAHQYICMLQHLCHRPSSVGMPLPSGAQPSSPVRSSPAFDLQARDKLGFL